MAASPAPDIDLARLAPWLATHVEGFAGPVAVEKFSSNTEGGS